MGAQIQYQGVVVIQDEKNNLSAKWYTNKERELFDEDVELGYTSMGIGGIVQESLWMNNRTATLEAIIKIGRVMIKDVKEILGARQ